MEMRQQTSKYIGSFCRTKHQSRCKSFVLLSACLTVGLVTVYRVIDQHMRQQQLDVMLSWQGNMEDSVRRSRLPLSLHRPPDIFNSSTDQPMRVCTQRERITHIRNTCNRIRETLNTDLLTPSSRTMSDDIHKILYCYMSKVGCTAFKTLLLKANANVLHRSYLLPSTDAPLYIHAPLRALMLQVPTFTHLNKSERDVRLKTYFKFMVMRHPFERLISAWRDKVLHPKTSEYLTWPTDVLLNSRVKSNSYTSYFSWYWRIVGLERYYGMPRFDEFLQWIKDQKIYNEHWLTAMDSCHVCANDWDAILRIETMHEDGHLVHDRVVDDLPDGDKDLDVIHSYGANKTYHFPSLELPLWHNVSVDVEDYFLKLYSVDMELFGYKWDRNTKSTGCRIDTPNGPCC